ncbi:MAG: hypothetical protein IJP64_03695 [Oscillospiraceae bacterium]|nr:hypothetical protein [Oscillospiraceae bacterium]
MEKRFPKVQRAICAAGLTVLALLFLFWIGEGNAGSASEFAAALLCLLLFAALGLHFVPAWFSLWFGPETINPERKGLPLRRIIGIGLISCLGHLTIAWGILRYVNRNLTPESFLQFWKCADAYHYLCIAKDWYLSEGSVDRVVQLVFLPGYPIAVRIVQTVVRSYILSGMLVSILSFCGALGVFYRLVLLDHEEDTALRAVILLCLTPGAFFFVAPMSESLFLLLSVSCLYLGRKHRWLLAGGLGALASFTRSLGLLLFVPLFMEMLAELLHGSKKAWRGLAALLMIPLGFGAYCLINYFVAGNPFQFMIYQREHWSQELGLFFSTPAYQIRYALGAGRDALMGLWGPNLAVLYASLLILTVGAKRLRASYTLWAMVYYAVSVGATWLLSAPRYMAVLLPLPMSLACLGEKKGARIAIYVLLTACELYYLTMFVLRKSVW